MSELNYGPSSFCKSLSEEEAAVLFEKAKHGDLVARNKLIETNMKLVLVTMRGLRYDTNDRDDIVSIGMQGLVCAVDNFDPSKGHTFATYACKCIRNRIYNQYYLVKSRANGVVMSCDDVVAEAADGDVTTILDLVRSKDDTEEAVALREKRRRINKALELLPTDNYRFVITELYGLNGRRPCTQVEIAKKLGCTKGNVSIIHTRALKILKEVLSRDDF